MSEITKDTSLADENQFVAIEYSPDFSIDSLQPIVGNIFQIFIPQKYFSPNHKPYTERAIYGVTHYSPNSDLVVLAMHSGALFIHPKSKSATRRRFCTVRNFFEVQNCSEAEYAKMAQVIDIPLDLTIQGILLHVLIDHSPSVFPQFTRNGIKSQDKLEPSKYSLRIANFYVISMYDDMPKIVSEEQYVRRSAAVPSFKFSSTGEVGIVFKPQMFLQILSRFNVLSGFFKVNRLFFDISNERYEIIHLEDATFRVIKFNKVFSLSSLRRKGDLSVGFDVEFPKVELSKISVFENGIIIDAKEYSPIDVLLISSNLGE